MTIDEAIAREKELTDHCKKMLEGIEKDRQGSYDCGYYVGYNKAIDDIKEKLMKNGFIYTQFALDVFNEIAEQLKAGVNNEYNI